MCNKILLFYIVAVFFSCQNAQKNKEIPKKDTITKRNIEKPKEVEENISFDNIKSKFAYYDIDTMKFIREYEGKYFLDSTSSKKYKLTQKQLEALGFGKLKELYGGTFLLSLNKYKNFYIVGFRNGGDGFLGVDYYLCDNKGEPVKYLFGVTSGGDMGFNLLGIVVLKGNEINVWDLYCGLEGDFVKQNYFYQEKHFKVTIFENYQIRTDTLFHTKTKHKSSTSAYKYFNQIAKKFGAKYEIGGVED